jgi:hypothetical protein
MSKKRNWPPELKGPFPMKQLEHQANEVAWETRQPEQYNHSLRELWEKETRQRVALIAQFFDEPWPQSEEDWLELIFLICTTFEAPGFQSRRLGAHEKWDDVANARLFADVMSVVVKQERPSEHEAVKRIVSNPTKFLNRYSKYKFLTLHRQFLRAKRQFEQKDRALRDDGDDPTDRSGRIMSRDEVIRREIDLCSAEAYRKRRAQIAQKSATPKNA